MASHLILPLVLMPMAAALLSAVLGRLSEAVRNAFVMLTCAGELILSALLLAFLDTAGTVRLLSFTFEVDGFRGVYGVVCALMWLGAALLSPRYFARHENRGRFYFFFLLTLGATLGVFFSADLMTTFTFFEIMSFTSYVWVVQEQTKDALAAGKTYLTVAVLGGLVALMGLFLLYRLTGTLAISALAEACAAVENRGMLYAAAFCILFGFGAKAGLFPLHIWLPKAHPVAPAPASALLSGVLTKTGVLGMLLLVSRILAGERLFGGILMGLGAVTMVLGAVLAVFSVDLKRTLACSSLSQIGFITVGAATLSFLGQENAIAANGTLLYMVNHSLCKLVLFLCAGAIYIGAHSLDLNRLRGAGRKKPWLAVPFLVGACSLAGIPGTLGYLSKTLVHEAIVECAALAFTAVEWLFLFSGGLTAAYMAKLFAVLFLAKPAEACKLKPTAASAASLWLGAVPLLVLGVFPYALTERLGDIMVPFVGGQPLHGHVDFFAWVNLKGVLISLSVAAAMFFGVIRPFLQRKEGNSRICLDRYPAVLDLEARVYAPVGRGILAILGSVCRGIDVLPERAVALGVKCLSVLGRVLCDATDLLILALRRTVLRPADPKPEAPRYAFLIRLGNAWDRHRKAEPTTAQTLVREAETLRHTTGRITESFSFSLFMACLGVSAILGFLILFLVW